MYAILGKISTNLRIYVGAGGWGPKPLKTPLNHCFAPCPPSMPPPPLHPSHPISRLIAHPTPHIPHIPHLAAHAMPQSPSHASPVSWRSVSAPCSAPHVAWLSHRLEAVTCSTGAAGEVLEGAGAAKEDPLESGEFVAAIKTLANMAEASLATQLEKATRGICSTDAANDRYVGLLFDLMGMPWGGDGPAGGGGGRALSWGVTPHPRTTVCPFPLNWGNPRALGPQVLKGVAPFNPVDCEWCPGSWCTGHVVFWSLAGAEGW